MSLAQASKEKGKVKLAASEPEDEQAIELLPKRLRGLIARSKKLKVDVVRLDATIHAAPSAGRSAGDANPVERQLGLLKAAFEQDAG